MNTTEKQEQAQQSAPNLRVGQGLSVSLVPAQSSLLGDVEGCSGGWAGCGWR